jgi:hypothetical protein
MITGSFVNLSRRVAAAAIAAAVGATLAGTAQATAPAGASRLATSVDWANASLTVRSFDTRCAGGTLDFHNGEHYTFYPDGSLSGISRQGPVAYGDVNHDGAKDALLSITCFANGDPRYSIAALFAYDTRTGTPALLGTVTEPPLRPLNYRVKANAVLVQARTDRDEPSPVVDLQLKLVGDRFAEVSGNSAYVYSWRTATLQMPFKADQVPLPDRGRPCPKITGTFEMGNGYSRGGRFRYGNWEYDLDPLAFGDVNHDGVTDTVVRLICGDIDGPQGQWLYAYTIRDGKPALLGYLTARFSTAGVSQTFTERIEGGNVLITQSDGIGDPSEDLHRSFRWTGSGFVGSPKLTNVPGADVAP